MSAVRARAARPRAVTLLAVALLLAGGLQLLGSAQAAQQAREAVFFPADRLAWLSVAAALYGAAGLALLAAAAGLMWMRRWGWWLALAAPVLAALARWGLRLGLERAEYSRASQTVDAAWTAIALALVWLVLWWPTVRKRFRARGGRDG